MNLLNLFSLAIEIAEQFNLLPLVTASAIQIMILFADIMSRGGGRSVTACNCYSDHNFDC